MFEAILANAFGGVIAVLIVALYNRIFAKKRHFFSRRRSVFIVFGIAFVVIFLTDLTPIPVGETIRVAFFGPPSQNERWTRDASRAFERNDYDTAILSANKVVDLFGGTANRQQELLKNQNEPVPPVGRVFPWRSGNVASRGILNDVASSYWILGQSYENKGRGCEARDAYTAASRLTYARTWDPQWWPLRGWSPFGWFWSPAEVAQDRVAKMSCEKSFPAK
jgi:hypothetical protein